MNKNNLQVNSQLGILNPVNEIFEAIVDPEKMSKYFITSGSGRMLAGSTITWSWEDYNTELEIKVQKVEKDKAISFYWTGIGIETLVEINLESINETSTLVKVQETEWLPDEKGIARCIEQTKGWTHFLCCLKTYLEYGINLREGGIVI